jgi:hypothetical protein
MHCYLTYNELVSLASLEAIAEGPSSVTVVLSHVRIDIVGSLVTAYATDRLTAARIVFSLANEIESGEPVRWPAFTIAAAVLKKATQVAKGAHSAVRNSINPLVRVDLLEDGGVSLTVNGVDTFKSYPPKQPGSDRVRTYPHVDRLFPNSDEHEHAIEAGLPLSVEKLAAVAKLRHPDDTLTGRAATNFGGYRISRGSDAENSPVFLTRHEARVAVIVAPIKERFAARGSL